MSETKETLLEKIARKVSVILTSEDSKKEVKLEKAKLKDGTIVEIEGDSIFVLTGDEEGAERLPAPVANHELENGDVVVVEEEGVIKEVIKADAAEEDLKEEDKEKMEFASKEDMQNLKNEMDELRKMVEGKKEEMTKEDLAKAEAEKAELAKQELAKQEPPKKVTHTPEGTAKRNTNLYAQKGVGSTKSIVFKKLYG
jgi:hypothetical protein